jgi:hypothetical protein
VFQAFTTLRQTYEMPSEERWERLRQFILLCAISWAINLAGVGCVLLMDGNLGPAISQSPTGLAIAGGFAFWSLAMLGLLIGGVMEFVPRRRSMLGILTMLPACVTAFSVGAYYAWQAFYHVMVAVFHVGHAVI